MSETSFEASAVREVLLERLTLRAKAFASSPDLLTDATLELATEEAMELAGEQTPLPVLMDIAFYRLLLQIGHTIDEADHKAYRTALAQAPPSAALPIASPSRRGEPMSQQRGNPYQ